MNRRSLARSVLSLAAAAAALTVPAAAAGGPAPTRAALSHTAGYVSPSQINLAIALTCDPGYFYSISAQVTQPQGFSQVSGSGFTNGQCTGQQQKIAVPVFGFFPGWILGDAVASVAACTYACDTLTRTVRIALR